MFEIRFCVSPQLPQFLPVNRVVNMSLSELNVSRLPDSWFFVSLPKHSRPRKTPWGWWPQFCFWGPSQHGALWPPTPFPSNARYIPLLCFWVPGQLDLYDFNPLSNARLECSLASWFWEETKAALVNWNTAEKSVSIPFAFGNISSFFGIKPQRMEGKFIITDQFNFAQFRFRLLSPDEILPREFIWK